MKLSGKVVKVGQESYVNKTSGVEVQMFRIYLEAGDVLSGALEVSVTEAEYAKIKKGDLVTFTPSFSTRTWNRNLLVTAKVLEDLEISKA